MATQFLTQFIPIVLACVILGILARDYAIAYRDYTLRLETFTPGVTWVEIWYDTEKCPTEKYPTEVRRFTVSAVDCGVATVYDESDPTKVPKEVPLTGIARNAVTVMVWKPGLVWSDTYTVEKRGVLRTRCLRKVDCTDKDR